MKNQRTCYLWLTGQDDNIGDSLLRRPYAQALRKGSALRVWAGDPSAQAGYISGLDVTSDEVVSSYWRWVLEFTLAAVRSRADLALNAGEFTVTRRGYLCALALLPGASLLRIRKSRIIWAGAGVKSVRAGFTWPFRVLARWATTLSWREGSSGARLGVTGTVRPDWAFRLGDEVGTGLTDDVSSRPLLAISLRGDRPAPPLTWLEGVAVLAVRCGLQPVVVVQVRRDSRRASQLATALGADLVPWQTERHRDQETLVRSVYRRSSVIISDRLHALIVGATEGAVPLGWTQTNSGKIDAHFRVVGLRDIERAEDAAVSALAALDPAAIYRRRDELAGALERSRRELASLETELAPDSSQRLSAVLPT